MAKHSKKTYTHAEKRALVADIERLYAAGGRTYASIALELGIGATRYHAWLSQGIEAAVAAVPAPTRCAVPTVFSASERARLVAEVDGLRARGNTMKGACRAVGISDKSYRKWKDASAAPLAMRQVEVTALVPTWATGLPALPPLAPITPALALLAPGGYRVEGLCVETAAQLLRALA